MTVKELNIKAIKQLSKDINLDLNQESFCILPFSHLSTSTTGEIRLCCRSKAVSNIKKETVNDCWNGSKLKKIREQFIKGEKPVQCQNCWKLEDKKLTSLREGQNTNRINLYKKQLTDYLQNKKIQIPSIELKLSNRCNFKCKMCSPAASNRWNKDWNKIKPLYNKEYSSWIEKIQKDFDSSGNLSLFMSNDKFKDELKYMSEDLNLIDFAGGEPLIDPLHYSVLKNIIKHGNSKQTTLRYSTNLSVLSFDKFSILELWSKFKNIELTISVDGDAKINEYIRTGANSKILAHNIEQVKNIPQVTSIKGTTTISALNAPFILETVNFILGELNIPWHTSRVQSPKFLDARIWPLSMRKIFLNQVQKINLNKFNLSNRALNQAQRHINDFSLWMSDESVIEGSFDSFIKFIYKFNQSDEYLEMLRNKYNDFSNHLTEQGL